MRRDRRLTSCLGTAIAAYVALKRALGRGFSHETDILGNLDHFLVTQASNPSDFGPESFSAWCLSLARLAPGIRRNHMRVARNLCLYMRRSDPKCFVPDASTFPTPHQPQGPYIFTEEEVLRILRAATALRPSNTSPLHADVLRLAIVLLYTAGLRRGELVRLVISDYDQTEHTLLVRKSKFHKSRLVALSSDAVQELERYLVARRRLPFDANAPLLVSCGRGLLRPYSGGGMGQGLRSLIRDAGILSTRGSAPRVHDLRHTHAVHVLLRWYRTGVDVQAKLPALAASMGHVSVASTAYYLTLIAPVAGAASVRFLHHCKDILAAPWNQRGER